jgi:3-dehydroquinate synthase
LLRDELQADDVFVLTERRVHKLYGAELEQSFAAAGLRQQWVTVPEGERAKSLVTFARVLDQLADLGCARRSVIVNFGGGAVSDLGGFVAASFMRGIRYVNLATSLIAQVDAAVGGKVAVNARLAKNLYGAFHHPSHVGADPTLAAHALRARLPQRHGRGDQGGDPRRQRPSWQRCSSGSTPPPAAATPTRSPRSSSWPRGLKMDWISRDPYERDLRRPLNLGHTIGHPIETEYQYKKIRHGEAVAIGLGVATCLALRKRLIAEDQADRIFALLRRYGLLGFWEPVRAQAVFGHLQIVRRIRGNNLHFVLPTKMGAVQITDDVDRPALAQAFDDYEEVVTRLAPRPAARRTTTADRLA